MPGLVQLAERYIERRRNPADPIGEASDFLRALSAAGEMETYSTAEWIEAGRRFQMTDDEILAWMDNAAGWLVNTDDHPSGLEPAAWTEL